MNANVIVDQKKNKRNTRIPQSIPHLKHQVRVVEGLHQNPKKVIPHIAHCQKYVYVCIYILIDFKNMYI